MRFLKRKTTTTFLQIVGKGGPCGPCDLGGPEGPGGQVGQGDLGGLVRSRSDLGDKNGRIVRVV